MRNQILDKLQVFAQLNQLYEAGNQTALAEFYGRQKASKSTISFLVKKTDNETGISFYIPNRPAQYNIENEYHLYTRLMENTEQTVLETYTYPLLEGAPKILNYTEDIRNLDIKEQVIEIANKWRGIPLKGLAQEELLQEFIDKKITDAKRKIVTTFRGCCAVFSTYGVEIKTKKAVKKDLESWP